MRDDNRAWRAHLVTGLALAAAHLLLPVEASSSSYAFLAVAVTGPIAIAIGMGRQSHGWPWMMVLLGTSVMVAGDVLWTWYDEVAGVDPFPSLADALYLPGYPLIAFGLLRMLRHRQHGNARAGLIDATIIATGCGVLAWVFLIAPYVRDTELTISERAVSSAYPLMGILLVAVVARLSFARRPLHVGDLLISLGLVALLVADVYLGVLELTVGYEHHPVPEFLWLAMYVFVGAAALAPDAATASPDKATAPTVRDRRLPRMRLPLLLLASLMAPGVLAWHAIAGRNVDLFVIAAGSTMLFLLVLARVLGLVREVEDKAAQVSKLAAADPLTGLSNRRHWDVEIQRLLSSAERSGESLCVAMLDLDHFKRFNDTHGHYAGDTMLGDCADGWQAHLRGTDVLARIGGEEFALALPKCEPERAEDVVDRLRDAMPGKRRSRPGSRSGTAPRAPGNWLIRADMALYTAKAEGRNRTVRAGAGASMPLEDTVH